MPWTFYNSAGQRLSSAAAIGIENVVEDTTPQLGGHLDMHDFGLDFSDQTSADDADILDDYEEGSWTVTVADTTLNGTSEGQTYGTREGRYTKIGDMCFITCRGGVNSLGTMDTGQGANIMGLPFPTYDGSGTGNSMILGHSGSMAIAANSAACGCSIEYTSHISLLLYDGDATGGPTALLISELSASANIRFSFAYHVEE